MPSPEELGRSLRELHEALAGFPGDLAPVREIRDWLARLLDSPGLAASDTDPLRARLEALTPSVFESALPAQALHGDASLSNVLRTRGGLVWNDFEDVCFGPVEWDVAGLATSARVRDELLAGYGTVGDLEPFLEAHALYATIWRAYREGCTDRRS